MLFNDVHYFKLKSIFLILTIRIFFVYILTNKSKTVLYVGFTNNLKLRVSQHALGINTNSFTKRYHTFYLVYFEKFNDPRKGIIREKEIKKWRREKKDALVSSVNPNWDFLNDIL